MRFDSWKISSMLDTGLRAEVLEEHLGGDKKSLRELAKRIEIRVQQWPEWKRRAAARGLTTTTT